jgi:hypothetical protein
MRSWRSPRSLSSSTSLRLLLVFLAGGDFTSGEVVSVDGVGVGGGGVGGRGSISLAAVMMAKSPEPPVGPCGCSLRGGEVLTRPG